MPYNLNEKRIFDLATTSPIKLFEFMASKRPIVSLQIPTIEKITRHKKEAYLARAIIEIRSALRVSCCGIRVARSELRVADSVDFGF